MQKYHFGLLLIVIFFLSISFSPSFADHATASVSTPQGTSVPGCETTNECFIPYEVTVDVGGVVTWSNDDSAAHTVTAGSAADGQSGVFDSSLFMAGTTFSHTFETEGEFPYFCLVHPWMEGTVTVNLASDPKPTPSVSVSTDRTSYAMGDSITISGNSKSDYFFEERVPAADCRVVDAFGNGLSNVSLGQQLQISCDVANSQDKEQAFAFLINIQDSDGVTVSLSWITGSLLPGKSFSPALSWVPTNPGVYRAEAFIFESVYNPIPLSRSEMIFVKVDSSESLPSKPTSGEGAFRSVILEITNSFGSLVLIDQITPKPSGTFSQEYILDGPLIKSGSYTVTVYQANAKDANSFSLTIPTKPTDSDSDGKPDTSDPCPKDPKNDSDNDGVCGNVDSCPTQYGTQSNGCPEEQRDEPKDLDLAPFVDPAKDPQSYVDRYNHEPSYKKWFDDNFPEYNSIYEAVGLEEELIIPEGPGSNGGQSQSPGSNKGVDYTTWVIVGIVIASGAGGAGLAISRSRKSSASGTIAKTVPTSIGVEKGTKCNVCGTIIPEGKNVCPNCGDTYS